MLFFRSEEHVERWCRIWNLPKGAVLDLETCRRLAEVWYGPDRRDPQWRRRTPDEAMQVFSDLGLRGSFWDLSPS